MNNRQALFALHQIPGIGWKTIERVAARVPELTDIFAFSSKDWTDLGLPPARAELIYRGLLPFYKDGLKRIEAVYGDQGIGWVTVWDEDYPELLRETAQPPWVLYYRGQLDMVRKPCIAVVGTRNPTAYGKMAAERLSQSLSTYRMCIVSGLARGIDSAAHDGGLTGPGSTIAVLGCSINEVYPPENRRLYDRITEKGLVLSEYPIGTKGHPGLFPQRNRIIAGLSLGVLVVEAAIKSGSLITADQALEESRDVFAVPGLITSPKSAGTLSLLKQGAKLVTCAEDIAEEYRDRIADLEKAHHKDNEMLRHPVSQDEQKIIDLLTCRTLTIDELLEQTQYTFGHLHSVLINLLMIRRIVELPGSVYTVP
ncbi:DNA-processing protein DprA [Paenibacillus filicis]|uniref:DNA-processing protein DprA n=1 Tax=Paenibacillus gyeongsangnamensis TaxID=3388067 RepID=A0ABT4Q6E0_9BACL|nr:DNA-processing protein DprA [Paenibacillus filicis]MCZ8512383.1 DNA-processing protein DprA [Paenibacillus filicis]